MVTIADVMKACRNYFVYGYNDANYSITTGGKITPADDIVGYVAVQGSHLNDGVYFCENGTLEDGRDMDFYAETFSGRIWMLAPPRDFIAIVGEIELYEKKNAVSPMQGESFGAYSYTKASGKRGVLTWQEAFADRLRPYMRLLSEVDI